MAAYQVIRGYSTQPSGFLHKLLIPENLPQILTLNDIHEHMARWYKKDSTHSTHNSTDTTEMLKLLATAAVLLALTPQWVDSTTTAISHSKGHVLMKVG